VAEKRAAISDTVAAENIGSLSPDETQKLIHELKVHQIELEMQNEELRTTQAELEESHNRYFDLYDLAPIGYVTVCEDGLILQANLTASKLLSLDRGSLVGQSISKFIVNDDQDRYYLFLKRLIKTEEVQVCELRIKKTNNSEVWVRLKASCNEIDQQSSEKAGSEGCRYRIVLSDITEQKQAEEIIKGNLHHLETVLNTVTDGITLSDWEGNFEIFNHHMEEICGYTKKEANEDPLFIQKLYPCNVKLKEISEKTQQLLLDDGINAEETEIMTKSGAMKSVLVATSVFKRNDKPYFLTAYHDITNRKELEVKQQELKYQLNQSQKLESLGLLAGGIAHDFNNLLGGMFGYVEMAQMEITEGDLDLASKNLKSASSIFDRTKVLTQQLLTFSKGGAPTLKSEEIEPLIRAHIPDAISISNSTIKYMFDTDLWQCNCDKNQIGQVIHNILCNAQESMPKGGNITVAAKNVHFDSDNAYSGHKMGDYIKISITDVGRGIAKDALPKIYDPFYTTKRVGKGLGLATVYSIIKRHNGLIDVETELEEGSTFDVYLPAASTKESIDHSEKGEPNRSLGRVLIMDDEDFIRVIESSILKRMGYEVVMSKDGDEAISLFSEAHSSGNDFAFTLLDLTIPNGMGGKETVKAIKQLDEKAVVFVVSGYADDPVMQNPSQYGFVDKISKPFRQAAFVEVLHRNVKR